MFDYPAAASVATAYGLMVDRFQDRHSFSSAALYALSRRKMAEAERRLRSYDLSLSLEELVSRQHLREGSVGRDIVAYSKATEEICSSLFSHSAKVAGAPENSPALAEVGRHIGRIAYLVDGYTDAEEDGKKGHSTPATPSLPPLGRQ